MAEIDKMQPGSVKALHLVVADARKAREALASQGVEVGDVEEHDMGIKYVSFSDPDGNSWVFQEMPWRIFRVYWLGRMGTQVIDTWL